ncbi:MAG TPA: LysM peptidoglycan-binding domain-containing M23 family metallopeptidase [Spirochaetota bacterium]|nr:LysM peptidoglycan-binding domain-containing M23 family metallopeptidase [Spirochaetota bacterium]HPJ33388.1 LysM peptidoglycan-binding domain-containing M23 family metallopeptidase [Spirochaetota bacterium]
MRQRVLLFIISAAVVVLQLSAGGSVLFAESGREGTKADRAGVSYAAVYDSGGAEEYRDITPISAKCVYNPDNNSCRAASVSGGSKCRITVYTVKKGDTLYSISRKKGVTVDSISDLNRIKGNRIYSGMKLKIRSCGENGKAETASKNCSKNYSSKSFSSSGKFAWPLKKVSSYKRDGSSGIKSIGIFIKGVPNCDVVASQDGVVKKIGYMRGYGQYVAISHKGRYVTVYSNLSCVRVKEGARVSRGMVIGGLSSDRTLHFQIGHAGKPENPLKHLPGRRKG